MKVFIKALVLFGLLGGAMASESGKSQLEPPGDTWYRAFQKVQEAKKSEDSGDFPTALQATDLAFEQIKSISLNHPEFHSEVVKNRLRLLAEQQFRLRNRLTATVEQPPAEAKKEALKNELEALKKRRKELKDELKQLQKESEKAAETIQREFRGEEITLKGVQYVLTPKEASSNITLPKIPDNWIPRKFEDQMTYIIPLIETTETQAFTRSKTVPAVLRSGVQK